LKNAKNLEKTRRKLNNAKNLEKKKILKNVKKLYDPEEEVIVDNRQTIIHRLNGRRNPRSGFSKVALCFLHTT